MARAPERRRTRTASTCTAETVRTTHSFKIAAYSRHRGLGVGRYVSSGTLSVDSHECRIRYYPGGRSVGTKDYVVIFLNFSKGVGVDAKTTRVLYEFRMLNPATGQSSSVFSSALPATGTSKFMKRSEMEASDYLQDDCLTLECHLTVIKQSLHVEEVVDVQVPQSDLLDHLGKLVEAGEGSADVTIHVQGEVFRAHKFMLVIRSPVLKAELYGPVGEKGLDSITIDGMEPGHFKALLHYIYTDSFPAMDDPDGNVSEETVRKLLVAADRYALERIKLICEDILCKRLDVKNVAAMLAFADRQNCTKLKDTCMEFIKRVCSDVFIDMWEKEAKSRKMQYAGSCATPGTRYCRALLGVREGPYRLEVKTVATTLALAHKHDYRRLKDACVTFINSSDRVISSIGYVYVHQKKECLDVFVQLWEKSAKSCKN